MTEQNNALANSLVEKLGTLLNKKRKTLTDYGMISMYEFIQVRAGVFDYHFKDSRPTQEEIDKASLKHKEAYAKLLALKSVAERYYDFFNKADCQLVLFYDRIMGYVHSFVVYEKIEKHLSEKLGPQGAKDFMLQVEEGLLIDQDITNVRDIIEASSTSFGISSQTYIYAFYSWLDIVKEVFSIPELDLLKDEAHTRATIAIYSIQDFLSDKVYGNAEETATKLKNISRLFETIPHFDIDDYRLNKRQLADLKNDAKAFKKGVPNTPFHMSLFEMYVEKQEKLTNVYRKSLKEKDKQRQ